MNNEKQSFIFYRSFFEAIKNLDDKKRLKMYDLITNFALNSEEIDNKFEICEQLFTLIKPQLFANNKRYEDGKKGGRPKKEKTTGFSEKKPNENVNENVNENAQSEKKEIKKEKVFISSSNPDLMFDKRINEVFSLYKKLCPNLCPLVFEERNLERRQEAFDLLVLCRNDLNYIQGLFMRANEQITFYDNKINFKSLIKNHEAIYQGLGKKQTQKETAESMKDKFKEWQQRAEEREALSG